MTSKVLLIYLPPIFIIIFVNGISTKVNHIISFLSSQVSGHQLTL